MNYRIHEPSLHATPVLDLRPTQMTLGMSEVSRKRKSWKSQGAKVAGGIPRPPHGPGRRRPRRATLPHRPSPPRPRPARRRRRQRFRHHCRRLRQARRRRVLEHHGFPRLDPSLRRQGTPARLRRSAQDRRRDGGRPLPFARRRAALRRRLRQGYDAVLGIRLGRLPAPPHQAEGPAQELRRRRPRRRSRSPNRRRRTTCRAGARRTAARRRS